MTSEFSSDDSGNVPMPHRRERWKSTLLGVISYPKQLSAAALRLWPAKENGDLSHYKQKGQATQSQPQLAPIAGTSFDSKDGVTVTNTAATSCLTLRCYPEVAFTLAPLPFEDESQRDMDRLSIGDILYSKPTEVLEDVQWIIFTIAARNNPQEALNTFVYVNQRVRHWVEPFIYESVILRDTPHARIFLDALKHKNVGFAERVVRVLALPPNLSFDVAFKIISECKNVRHLSWLATDPLPPKIMKLVSNFPLISLRARLTSFMRGNPDFSAPLFKNVTTLFVEDRQSLYRTWKWDSLKKNTKLKWISFNVEGKLVQRYEWEPVHTLEQTLVKPYCGPNGIQLCVCYSYRTLGENAGDRWIWRTEWTYSEENISVLSLQKRIDDREWEKRVNGERNDFDAAKEEELRRMRIAQRRYRLEHTSGTRRNKPK